MAAEDDDFRRDDVQSMLQRGDTPVPPNLDTRARDLAARIAAAEAYLSDGEPALGPGTVLGAYEVVEQVGVGGQGRVYRVKHRHLGRLAAAKVPWRSVAAKLLAEARLAERVKGERIVAVQDVAPEADPPHMLLEWCPGGSLAERIAASGGAGLPLADVRAIAGDVLRGLATAHRAGVVHCDVKPGNVLFGADGRAKIADLGIGRIPLEEHARLSNTAARTGAHSTGVLAGTPLYVAPEQERPALLEGRPLDGRADLFALGKMLFEMLTGASPRTVRPPSRLRKGLDPRWDDLVFKLVEERRDARFATAEATLAALESLPVDEPLPTPAPLAAVADPTTPPRSALRMEVRPPPPVPSGPPASSPEPGPSPALAPALPPSLTPIAVPAPPGERRRHWLGLALAALVSAVWFAILHDARTDHGYVLYSHEQQMAGYVTGLAFLAVSALAPLLGYRRSRPFAAGVCAGLASASMGTAMLLDNLRSSGVVTIGRLQLMVYPEAMMLGGGLVWIALLFGWRRGEKRAVTPSDAPVAPIITFAPGVRAISRRRSRDAEASDSGERTSKPSLVGRILAVVTGTLALAAAVVGGAFLVFLVGIASAIRGCGHPSPTPNSDFAIPGAILLLGAGAGIMSVVWGVKGIIARAFRRRRERRARDEGE